MKKLWDNTNAGFILLNIVIVLALCLCSGIGTVNGRAVSVIEVVFKGYDNVRKLVTWADAFSVVLYGHLYLALPLIASIASLPIICDELRTNNFYFHFSRIGVKHYIHLKYLSCIVSGVGALFLGLILYGIFVRLFFPSSYDFGDSQVIGIIENNSFRMIMSTVGYLLYMLCYVAMLSIFSCGLVSVTQNIYVNLCVPFLLNYVTSRILLNTKIYVFLLLCVLFYCTGYRLWLLKYKGVSA